MQASAKENEVNLSIICSTCIGDAVIGQYLDIRV